MPNEKFAHSATAIEIKDGILLAYFAGDKEGAGNVKIYANLIKNNGSSKSFLLLSRARLIKDAREYISRLGNPVLVKDGKEIYLFVVATTIGGWATSKIYQYRLSRSDLSMHFMGSLHLSAFMNLSHLVRTNAVALFFNNDSGFLLPIYHEGFVKFPMALIFKNGKMIQKIQLSAQNGLIQPSIIARSKHNCMILYRNSAKNNVSFLQDCTSGFAKNQLQKMKIQNFDSSQILIQVGEQIYMIYSKPGKINNLYVPRKSINIALINEQKDIKLDETKIPLGEMSYPAALVSNNFLHIFYTSDLRQIAYIKIPIIPIEQGK